MTKRTTLALAAWLSACLILGALGPPKLIGIGCTNAPLGVTLAREESDISGTCRQIERITAAHKLWSN